MSEHGGTLGVLATAAVVTAVALGGCAAGVNPDSWSYKSKSDAPVLLATSGPVLIDVDSFNGNVIINADPRNTHASIRIRRQATHGYGRAIEADVSMDHIEYSAHMLPTGTGEVLRVRTWTSDAEPWFQRAHVTIDVPAVDGLSISTSNGTVIAWNVRGALEIETTRGDVRVLTNLPLVEPVSIRNDHGDIDYRVRGESSGEFDCRAIDGAVDQRSRFGHLIVHNGTTHDRLLATFNDGQNPVRLHTVHGDVRIAVVEDPTAVGILIKRP